MLGSRIVLNDFLFATVFDINFAGGILYMNGTLPDKFEVFFDGAKKSQFLNLFLNHLILVLCLYSLETKFLHTWLIPLLFIEKFP